MKKFPLLKIIITILRLAVGWHFLYEGLVKLFAGNWTAYGYLSNTSGFLSGFYHWLANNPSILKVVDFLNVYGLIFIGLGLFLGILTRYAAMAGALLLLLYYFAYPPFGSSLLWSSEGNLFVVDRMLIEALIMGVFIFLRDRGYSLDNLFQMLALKRSQPSGDDNLFPDVPGYYTVTEADVVSLGGAVPVNGPATAVESRLPSDGVGQPDPGRPIPRQKETFKTRREVLKNLATLPVLGALGLGAFRVKGKYGVDVLSGATIQVNAAALGELKGTLPKGKIGPHTMSRLVLGGNLIGGWAHSRDLFYVPSLFRAYNTEKKVYETLMLAENAGIDTINIGHPSNALMAKYKKLTGSHIKVICQVAPNMNNGDWYEQINIAIDFGVDVLQVQGNWCDWLVRDDKVEVIHAMLEKIRSQGYTAGLGAHTVDALICCEEHGIIPDYYMQTMHHDNYWSAHPMENRIPFEVDGKYNQEHGRFHDNIFCLFPDRTVEFVNRTKVPVMGFKILAAGAIRPEDGFRWAFENGADFICVGMFDYQIVKDVNITIEVLNDMGKRKRDWYA